MDWTDSAACLSEDPELFFPISQQGPGRAQVERAKAVCRRCGVRQACYDFAIRTKQPHGVWGGADPEERRAATAWARTA
ncbi:WhiB family transcriptional regulator [Thermoactinospora rubra]|uniref:WhiB family transcriptional regulator n=1 Tax=Thermoactinospora rubra TaxID=1088767 RepID=UPI000A102B5C|nr:WhiB family transcriptional regulator [Thermoactinospora rubra]